MIKTIPSCFRRKWTILGAMVVAIIMVYGFGLNYAAAATVEVDDFTIERSYSNDYVVTVKSYDGNATEVTLPTKATIDEVEYTCLLYTSHCNACQPDAGSATIFAGFKLNSGNVC